MYEDAKKGNKTTVIDPQGQVKAPEFIKKTKVNYNKEASQK
jgi:hypothetical protein